MLGKMTIIHQALKIVWNEISKVIKHLIMYFRNKHLKSRSLKITENP